MADNSRLIRNCRLARFDSMDTVDTDIRIVDGRITEIGRLAPAEEESVLDAQGMLCMPAFVDTHTHLVQSLQKGRMDGCALRTGW